ncbi:TetR/AcrR family transcriptional regulator [Nocardia callitridis]|uniref:TetR/AcrR family transcriptional regulator n=1 Tax=Nocardia callitridis TaxID=648753 RepID=A0ABP9KAI3_9NOCA
MTKVELNRDAIIDTAIALADADGLDAVSMRRIAERMGVGAMSLYRHIAHKDELLAAMTDAVAGRYPYPAPEGQGWNWRDRVRIAAEIDWALYQRHPWVLLAFATPRYSFGPQSLACLGWLVEGLRELNVSTREATTMAFTVWNYISGATLPQVSTALMRRNDTNPDGDNGLRDLLSGAQKDRAPDALRELVGSGAEDLTPEDLLHIGLSALCDGFEVRAARRADV